MIDPLRQVEQVIAEMRKDAKFKPPSQWDERNRVLKWADRLAAALQPPPVPDQGWRDIETAPTDGTQVLLFVPGYAMGRLQFVMLQGFNLASDRRGWRSTYAGGGVEPTHWMPIPDPPVERER